MIAKQVSITDAQSGKTRLWKFLVLLSLVLTKTSFASELIVVQIFPNEFVVDYDGRQHFETAIVYPGGQISLTKDYILPNGLVRDVGLKNIFGIRIDGEYEICLKFGHENVFVPKEILENLKHYLFNGPKPQYLCEVSKDGKTCKYYTCHQFAREMMPQGWVKFAFNESLPHNLYNEYLTIIEQDLSLRTAGDYITFSTDTFKNAPKKVGSVRYESIHSAIFIKTLEDGDSLLLSKLGVGPLAFSRLSELKKSSPRPDILLLATKHELFRR